MADLIFSAEYGHEVLKSKKYINEDIVAGSYGVNIGKLWNYHKNASLVFNLGYRVCPCDHEIIDGLMLDFSGYSFNLDHYSKLKNIVFANGNLELKLPLSLRYDLLKSRSIGLAEDYFTVDDPTHLFSRVASNNQRLLIGSGLSFWWLYKSTYKEDPAEAPPTTVSALRLDLLFYIPLWSEEEFLLSYHDTKLNRRITPKIDYYRFSSNLALTLVF